MSYTQTDRYSWVLNTRGWEAYQILDFPVILLNLLLSPPLPSPINFQTFQLGKKIFSQVYFEDITLCFTLINVLKVLHLCARVTLVVLLHDTYNYSSEQIVVKASKFLCIFIFLIIMCQQFFKLCSIYNSVADEFFI